MVRDNLATPPAEITKTTLLWRRPNTPTLAAVADAGAKQVAAAPKLAETRVGLELLGLTAEQIERVQAEWRRADSASILDRVLASDEPAVDDRSMEDLEV